MTSASDAAAQAKACCAAAYQHDIVRLVLGASYHPGGLALTRRLANALGLLPAQRVLDVASGTGATALLLAREFGVEVDGLDLGAQSVQQATRAAASAELDSSVRFTLGDAERIPFGDCAFDAVVCECAFCTFPDKRTAAAELARVLRPGGRAGITDVTIDPRRLPAELRSVAGWVACIADARPADEYAEILAAAGLRTILVEHHDDALLRMVEQVESRLLALRIAAGSKPALAAIDWDTALGTTALAKAAAADGVAGYALLVVEKPNS